MYQQVLEMKGLRKIRMAVVALVAVVGLTACGSHAGDGSRNGGSGKVAAMEGVWYLKSELWFTDETRQKVRSETVYPERSTKRIWMFEERGDSLFFASTQGHDLNKEKVVLTERGPHDYQYGSDRMVVKSVTDRELVVRYYHDYYNEGEQKECGVMVFVR